MRIVITIALLLGFSSIALAGQTTTLVCKNQSDIVEVINSHVNDGDTAAYTLAGEKMTTGLCTVTTVTHPNDPMQIVASFSAMRDNDIFLAMPLQNSMHAIIQLRMSQQSAQKEEYI